MKHHIRSIVEIIRGIYLRFWRRNWTAFLTAIGAVSFAAGLISDRYNGKNNLAAFLLIAGIMMFSISMKKIWLRYQYVSKMGKFKCIATMVCGFLMLLSSLIVGCNLVTAWLDGEVHVAVRGGKGFFVDYEDNPKKFGFYFFFYSLVAPLLFVLGVLMLFKPRGLKEPKK